MTPYSRQSISEDDIEAVIRVLKSNFITQGPVVEEFERAVAEYCGATHAVAFVNATCALHVALKLLDVTVGDNVWVPAVSFVATANCARFCGAEVGFVDVAPDTGLICPSELEKKLELAKRERRLPKVLIVVHLAGQSADMERIAQICQIYGVRLVEDAAHALSGEYMGKKVGCCLFSEIAVFSFHPVKPMTSGEGGMLVTNQASQARRARLLREHGLDRDVSHAAKLSDAPLHYEQHELGYNYRLSDIHSALGVSQISRLDHFLCEREDLAASYLQRLSDSNLKPLKRNTDCRSSWHLFVVQCDSFEIRNAILRKLGDEGFSVKIHYMPIPNQPYYQSLGARPYDYPKAQSYWSRSLSLPLFPGFQISEVDRVVALCESISRAR